jgi:hypothetical protein
MAKRITIRITTESFLMVRDVVNNSAACPMCAGAMVTLEEAGKMCGMTLERLERLLANVAIHRSTPSDLPPLICLRSLLHSLPDNSTA